LLSSRYDAITINDISINSAEYPFLIGYLPQAFSAFKNMTVYEMLYFFGKQKKITDSVISEQIDSALDMFNLKKEKDKKVKALSGGMLRRLGIAQSIMGDSKIILLDEPTVGLDVEERRRFWQVIGDFKNDRIVLISTHIINDVCTGCDNIILINEGKILYNGSVDELISGYSDVSQEDCMEINVENAYLYYMKGQA
jgi:ABC-2 type transport system ATP-binding protein